MDAPSFKPLTNRAASGSFEMPQSGWFQIAPLGEFLHEKSGVVQVIDDEAVKAIANSFTPGDELLIDFEHESHDQQKRTQAAGWIQNLAARSDGLFGQIRWSKSGEEAVGGGDYRYISPVWLGSDCQSLGNNRVRPLRLHDAGLTNRPNLKGISALANRAAETVPSLTHTGCAESQFLDHVKAHASKTGATFERAWDHVKSNKPELFQQMLVSHERTQNERSAGQKL